ncbi:MAG TPA: hypothetical protein DIW23_10230 [Anaerolineae bacterium]|nr:hypothetical protein [Anaerolineae bacterium]HRJ74596.1 hypothetical protein [Anaerolineales bacterium]
MKIKFFALIMLHLTLLACNSSTPTQNINTPIPLIPTEQISTPISSVPFTPTQAGIPEPVVIENSNGWVVYDDTNNIVSVNLDTGETKVLISRKEVEAILIEDKSSLSYTYGYEKPIKIILSPDFTKALISICASLDNNFRCVFEDYIYTIRSKSAIRLQPAPGAYGVYWQWSPDSSKLAGAAWTYVGAEYRLERFYSISSSGTDLRSLALIIDNHWQIAWHPGNSAILPLTFVQNFRSILTDASSEPGIFMAGLAQRDKIMCINFSPDYSRVAFVLRHELPGNQDSLYIARSDFQEIALVNSFATDPRYSCHVNWSVDQNFIHIDYQYIQREETGFEDLSVPVSGIDKVINIANKVEVSTPANAQICGFKPEQLIYINNGTSSLDLFNPTNSEVINLPQNVKDAVQGCPIQWFPEEPEPEVSEGIATENACYPNNSYIDDDVDPENIPDVFDLIEASSSLEGETLSVVLKSSKFTEYLVEYLSPNVTDFLNGWDVFIDVDNNTLTGDSIGIEYRFSVAIRAGSEPQIGSVILAYDPVTDTYVRSGTVEVRFDTLNQTLNLSGSIAGINPNSRLVFLSRLKDSTTREVTGDRICE